MALEIADFDAKPIFDQVRLTQDFHNLLFDATERATSRDLVSMVEEESALLGFLADPEECFTTALTIREATLTQDRYRDLPLRIGISLGKAQIAEDEFGHSHVSGEGRQDADRLMHQGPPGQISVARQFVEVLSRTAPELAELLEYQGLCSDSVGTPLCLYRVCPPQVTGLERPSDQPPIPAVPSDEIDALTQSDLAPIAVAAQSTAKSRNWLRRSWMGYALLLLLAGAPMLILPSRLPVEAPVSRRDAQPATATPQTTAPEDTAPLPASVAPEEMTPSAGTTAAALANDPYRLRPVASWGAKPIKEAAPAASPIEERAPATFNNAAASEQPLESDPSTASEQPLESEPSAGAEQPTETASVEGSGTLLFAVKPWGEVHVDGRKIGVTPPLKSFDVPLGRHLITITNSSLPIYQREVIVEPDAKITVVYDFSCISIREKVLQPPRCL